MDHNQQQQHTKVERFLKLGYSHDDIMRVLESLRHDAQTNDILEELIKTCHTRTYSDKSAPNSPKLVPRGCSPGPAQTRARADMSAAGFRPVVIDGSNVAMSHGDKKVFSCQGLQLAINWFLDKGVCDIKVFVPLWRKEQSRPEAPITDQHILHELESRRILVYTPSRCVNGKRVVCYDDRYIIRLAFESDGIIVSNDNYRDLQTENPQWKKFIEERLLMYTFVNDKFMPPDDPLGRNGPTIDDFLRKKPWTPGAKLQHCPYGKKCTYGVKCKFYHPERVNQSQLPVADELRAQRDRAKNYSPKPEPRYAAPTTPPPSVENKMLRASPGEQFVYQKDSSSLHHCPNSDVDEAFSSMESSMSRLYIHSMELRHHSYSSGVPSCSLSHDDSYTGNTCSCGGAYIPHQSCCCCQQSRSSPHLYQPAWSSCPALEYPGQFSDTQHFRQPSDRHSHSLCRSSMVSPCSEQRTGLKHKLSTLFPQSAVEKVMNDYPHVSDMFKLASLIQSYRMSHMSY